MTPIEKMPSTMSKPLIETSMEEDAKIEMLNYHDSAKTIERKELKPRVPDLFKESIH